MEDKVFNVKDLKDEIKKGDTKLSNIIIANDNISIVIDNWFKNIMTVVNKATEEDKEIFKEALTTLVQLSQDCGALQLMLEILSENTEEDINE